MASPVIVLVGGFLGAGKTTLIVAAAKILQAKGMRVGVITNDQDRDLVDTRFSKAQHLQTQEVVGGCFCCRFSSLLDAVEQLLPDQPDVIFAEPVGSCIDLSATVLQPLKAHHRVAPLTVLIDPGMALDEADTRYLSENQIAEADILCSTKADMYLGNDCGEFSVSGKTGAGVEAWLNEVLNGGRVAGSRLLAVDYTRYAKAEAALGWLNFHVDVRLDLPASPALLAGPLMDHIQAALETELIPIAHLKMFCQSATGFIKVSLCANKADPQAEGDLTADPAIRHDLAINLRATADPGRLSAIVTRSLKAIHGRVEVRHQSSFRPQPPRPEYRFTAVV